ncbi:MAG: invasin domain 3-containing protein [Solirubrobacteraceae bacterium]
MFALLLFASSAQAALDYGAATQLDTFVNYAGGTAVATADFNGDGHPDVVNSNASYDYDSGVTSYLAHVHLGRGGTAGFGQPTTVPLGGAPSKVVICDLNEDGKPDMAVLETGHIEVLINDGDATAPSFTLAATLGGSNGGGLVAGDFDDDGRLDLAFAGRPTDGSSPYVQVWFRRLADAGNPGGFGYGQYRPVPAVGPLVAGDFDGDGKLDLATASDLNVYAFAGTGAAGLSTDYTSTRVPLGDRVTAATGGNLTADTKADLAVATAQCSTTCRYFLFTLRSHGDGAFSQDAAQLQPLAEAQALTAVDLNRDGMLDVASAQFDTSTGHGSFMGALNHGDGSFGYLQNSYSIGDISSGAFDIATADFNGDTAPDLILGSLPGTYEFDSKGIPATVVVTAADASIVADGASSTTATATITDKFGNPSTADAVTIRANGVTQTASDYHTTGYDGKYTVTIPSTKTAGEVTVSAVDTTASPPISGETTFQQIAGPAANVTITVSPDHITADGQSTATATATVADANANPVSGHSLTFASDDTEQVVGVTTDQHDGTYTATIKSGTHARTATITATDSSVTPSKSGAATLRQDAGAATNVALTLSPSTLTADGTSTSTATLLVKDTNANPVSGAAPTLTAPTGGPSVGTVAESTTKGTYRATVTASRTAGDVALTATAGSGSDQKTLTLTAGPASHVAVAMSPATIRGNGTATSSATATITDAQGNTVSGDTVTFDSDDPGQGVGTTTKHADGTYTATVTSSTTLGQATITATDSTPATSVSGHAFLTQERGPATGISLALTPSSVVANGTSTAKAVVTLTDAQSHPASGDTVTIASSDGDTVGTVSPGSAAGTYEATITSTTTVGTRTITARDTTTSIVTTATLTQRSLTDPEPPTATIASPADHSTYNITQAVTTSFSCGDSPGSSDVKPGPGIQSCTDSHGASAPAGSLDTTATGTKTYAVTALSQDGQQASTSITYMVLGPPTATIASPAGGATYAPNQVVHTTFSCADTTGGPGIATCTDSGGASSTDGGTLNTETPGVRTYSVTATSSDGQTATRAISYRVADAPSATISSPSAGRTYAVGESVATNFSCDEGSGGPGLSSCRDDRSASAPGGTLDTSSPGTRNYTVTAMSGDGRTGAATISYTVAAAPTAAITAPANGQNFPVGQNVATRFACAEGESGPGLRSCVDSSGAPAPGATLPTTVPGNHTYTVTATSTDGQIATRTISYTVAAPPQASITTPTDGRFFRQKQVVPMAFTCAEGSGGRGLKSCVDSTGATKSPSALSTATTGPKRYTVTATSVNGQTSTDSVDYTVAGAPTAQIISPPARGGRYRRGRSVTTRFVCTDGASGPGIDKCVDASGDASPTGKLDTSDLGEHTYTVSAKSGSGQVATDTATYFVTGPPVVSLDRSIFSFSPEKAGDVSEPRTVRLTNSGGDDLDLSKVVITGADANDFRRPAKNPGTCRAQIIAPGDTCSINLVLAPNDGGTKRATLSIASDAPSGPNEVDLVARTPQPKVGMSETALDWTERDRVRSGERSKPRTVTVRNTGIGDLQLGRITLDGADVADFRLTSTCEGLKVLEQDESCAVQVVYAPYSRGTKRARVTIRSNAGQSPDVVAVSGIDSRPLGEGPDLSLDHYPVTFTTQEAGSAVQTTSLAIISAKSGSEQIALSSFSIVGRDKADFSVRRGTCGDATPERKLGGENPSCTVLVSLDPTTVGTKDAQLRIVDSAPGSPHLVDINAVVDPVRGVLDVSAQTLNFEAGAGTGVTEPETVTLSNTGKVPVELGKMSFTGDSAHFKVAAHQSLDKAHRGCEEGDRLAPGGTCTVQVRLLVTDHTGNKDATLRIASDARGPALEVHLLARGRLGFVTKENPFVLTAPAVERFRYSRKITIRNTGAADLRITSLPYVSELGKENVNYHVHSDPRDSSCQKDKVLGVGATCDVEVGFYAKDAGRNYFAYLGVFTDVPGSFLGDQLQLQGIQQ